MDLYEHNTFDPWLGSEEKAQLLQELKDRWENETNGYCVFVAAIERRNVEELRAVILDKVKEMYGIKYPYRSAFF